MARGCDAECSSQEGVYSACAIHSILSAWSTCTCCSYTGGHMHVAVACTVPQALPASIPACMVQTHTRRQGSMGAGAGTFFLPLYGPGGLHILLLLLCCLYWQLKQLITRGTALHKPCSNRCGRQIGGPTCSMRTHHARVCRQKTMHACMRVRLMEGSHARIALQWRREQGAKLTACRCNLMGVGTPGELSDCSHQLMSD